MSRVELPEEGMDAHRIEPLMTMPEVARLLRISRRGLQDIIRRHPYYREVGRKKLFTMSDYENLLEALKCPSPSSPDCAPPSLPPRDRQK